MKIVVDHIPKCSSDCIFSRYFSCERRRCILTDNICSLDNDIPNECHKLTVFDTNKDFENQANTYVDEIVKAKGFVYLNEIYDFLIKNAKIVDEKGE